MLFMDICCYKLLQVWQRKTAPVSDRIHMSLIHVKKDVLLERATFPNNILFLPHTHQMFGLQHYDPSLREQHVFYILNGQTENFKKLDTVKNLSSID